MTLRRGSGYVLCAMTQLTAQQFAGYVDLAERLETPLIWLWNLPPNLAAPLRSLRALIHFHAVAPGDDAPPTLAVHDRRDESLWVVGDPAGCVALVERVAPRELWLSAADWQDAHLTPVRRRVLGMRRIWHMRRAPHPDPDAASDARAAPPGYGPVARDEVAALRAFDAAQYGQALDSVVDYEAIVAQELVHGVRSPGDGLVATALVGRPGRRCLTVSSVWSHPRHRRRGHARRLMLGILATCQREGRVCALNVEESNTAALHLYDGLGFDRRDTLVCATLRGAR